MLSVLIPTLNEEHNIKGCIESVQNLADEIVVLDSGSTDRTVELAQTIGAKVKERKFDNFATQKNFGIQSLSHTWILLLDADERATPELCAEIRRVLHSDSSATAYSIRRLTYFGRKRVRCWSGGRVVRLFRNGAARYDENRMVHEQLQVSGSVSALESPLHHYTFRDFSQYLRKVDLFTDLAAQQQFKVGKRANWIKLLLFPPARFLKTFVVRGGILDGSEGVLIASLSAYSAYLTLAKLWDLQNAQSTS